MATALNHCGVLAAALTCAGSAVGQVYDLNTDWSDAQNPNGAWSYREGSNVLPHAGNWGTSSFSVPQDAWARGSDFGQPFLPGWLKSNGSEQFAHDWIKGDVVVHTTDPSNGAGQGFANVAWTSPSDGEINVSGAVWMGRDIGRANVWQVYLNNTLLTTGTIGSGDIYDRAAPMGLDAGSGGLNALNDLTISAGDVLRLEFQKASSAGDFVGVNMTVALKAVPAPGSLAFLGAGLLAGGRRRRV